MPLAWWLGDIIAEPECAVGGERLCDFGEDFFECLRGEAVEEAVGDDELVLALRQWMLADVCLNKLDVLEFGGGEPLPCALQHSGAEVEDVDWVRGVAPDPLLEETSVAFAEDECGVEWAEFDRVDVCVAHGLEGFAHEGIFHQGIDFGESSEAVRWSHVWWRC